MFVSTLLVERIAPRRYRLVVDLVWRVEHPGYSECCTVPAGYVTDFASVPRPLWPIWPPDDRYTEAAVLHDWLISEGVTWRPSADWIMLRAMRACGVPRRQRVPIFLAVASYSLCFAWWLEPCSRALGMGRARP